MNRDGKYPTSTELPSYPNISSHIGLFDQPDIKSSHKLVPQSQISIGDFLSDKVKLTKVPERASQTCRG